MSQSQDRLAYHVGEKPPAEIQATIERLRNRAGWWEGDENAARVIAAHVAAAVEQATKELREENTTLRAQVAVATVDQNADHDLIERLRAEVASAQKQSEHFQAVLHQAVGDFMTGDYAATAGALAGMRLELAALREDKADLDWLEGLRVALNAHCGSSYGWEVVRSHLVNRLMLHTPELSAMAGVDVNDAATSGKDIRAAIRAARGTT
jgi:hypothetical protein